MGSWKPKLLTRAQMEERRRAAAEFFRQGNLSHSEISRQLGVSRESVSRWDKAWKFGGIRALRSRPASGRPPRLSKRQCRSLFHVLKRGAIAAGFPTERWTLKRIAKIIEGEFSVIYNPLYLSRFLKSSKWSYQYPIPYALERDEALILSWLRKDWPRIKKSAAEARRYWVY